MTQRRPDDYYDDEAKVYSQKRYPRVALNYVQFLFARRRDIVLRFLGTVIAGTEAPRSLFEMGCADGVLLRAIEERYPNAFRALVGSDVSIPMLEEARRRTESSAITYSERDAVAPKGSFTVALEIGVGALVLFTREELDILAAQLAPRGFLICSVAGRDSLAVRAQKTAAMRSQLLPYAAYEKEMQRLFAVKAVASCGIYVPFLWRFPALARVLQPLAEMLGTPFPRLAHERVYLLQKKS